MTGLWVMATAFATAVSFAGVQLVTSSVIRPVVPIVEADDVDAAAPTASPPTTATSVADGGASVVRTTVPARTTPTSVSAPPVTRAQPNQSATYATQGGVVTVRCLDDRIQLVSAAPRDGWRLDVKDAGPERVRVRFIGPERYVELFANCRDGVPARFTRNESIDDDPPRTTEPTRRPGDGGPGPGGDGRR